MVFWSVDGYVEIEMELSRSSRRGMRSAAKLVKHVKVRWPQ